MSEATSDSLSLVVQRMKETVESMQAFCAAGVIFHTHMHTHTHTHTGVHSSGESLSEKASMVSVASTGSSRSSEVCRPILTVPLHPTVLLLEGK